MRRLGVRWVLVGEDFRFGKGRAGDLATLRRAARTFSVEAMRTVAVDGERASSTAVRAALAAGDLEHARRAARPPVRDLRPRRARREARPQTSAFRPRTSRCGASRRSPASSRCACTGSAARRAPAWRASACGRRSRRPARRCSKCSCSTSTTPIYGRRVGVEFLHKLRDEERYADLDALTRQIARDVAQARDFFARTRADALTPRRRRFRTNRTPACPTIRKPTTRRR